VFSSSPRLGFLEKEGHLKYTFADALAAVADALAAVKEDLKQRGSRSVQGSVFEDRTVGGRYEALFL